MKKWKKYAGLLTALVLCLSLTACGNVGGTDVETDIETNAGGSDIETSAGGTDVETDWRTTGIWRSAGTITRNGEDTDVLVCVQKEDAIFYYDTEYQTVFDSVDYPITIEGDAWKMFQSIDFADMDGDGNSDVSMMFADSNSSLLMFWNWDMESEQFVFQTELSYLGEDDDGRGDQVPDNDDGVPSLMCDSNPFTDTKNVVFKNYEDGTYYYEDMTEDGMVILINTAVPNDFLNDTRSIEEYMTDWALDLCDSDPSSLAIEENYDYSAQMTFPVYIVTCTSGENEDTREWTVFAMNTDRYTYLYAFGSSCNAEDDVRFAYQDIFPELYLYY